jgi:outer membrane protein
MTFKSLSLAGLLAIASPAFAQSPTTQMPEGTSEIKLSMIAALVPVAEGRETVRAIVLPSASVLWSNGIFLAPGEVGMQLSEDPSLRYGPLLEYGSKARRADDPQDKARFGVEGGAFLRYRLAHNIGFSSVLLYGGGNDSKGVRLNLGASYAVPLTSHQTVVLGVGATIADSHYMQSYFGVNAAQAARGHRPLYSAGAGVKDVSVALSWDVELNNKFSVNSGIRAARLGRNASNSPLVQSRQNEALWTSLTYQF